MTYDATLVRSGIDRQKAIEAVRSLHTYDFRIVSLDFAASWSLAVGGILGAAFFSWWIAATAAFVVAVLATYRAVMFSHEIVHMGSRCPPSFWWIWNVFAGAPSMMASFIIESHLEHHAVDKFGTQNDPEYSPFGRSKPMLFLKYLASSPFVVVALFFRHLVLVPLSWLSGAVRRWVDQHASAGAIHSSYVRVDAPLIGRNRVIETLCFLWCVGVVAAAWTGVAPWQLVGVYFATLVAAFTLNSIRTVVSHRFATAGPVTWEEQVLDSVNLDGPSPWNELLAPVGMRFHATHHMFPKIPYHNLGRAHQRLWDALGPDSPYRSLSFSGLPPALRDLWRRSTHGEGDRRSAQHN
ncbi:MAG: fatty acid desaturase [Pseudomonadota bacterium]